jgi:prepilin peptidase CpaA
MTNNWLLYLLLACLFSLALWYDIVSRRVPNWLIGVGLLAGLALSFPSLRGLGAEVSLQGILTGFAVFLPLYLLRALGAGDVKLMATIGAFLGPIPTLGAALLTLLAGGVLSLIVALWSGSLMRVLSNMRLMGMIALSAGRNSRMSMRDVQTTGRLPYALAIAAGTALQLWAATQASWPFK